jgi:HAD superfamily hydrolase (TIGR01458 family)
MGIEGILLDIAGVLHDGEAPYAGAVAAVQRIRDAGLPLRFVTNTSRRTRARTVQRLAAMGLDVIADEVFTAPLAARIWVEQRALRPYLIIHPELSPDFFGLDTREPNSVLLADAAEFFNYERLDRAFGLISGGAPLIAVGRNRYFRDAGQLHLDAGPFVAALEYASGCEAVIAGKPSPAFFSTVLDDLGLAAGHVMMIGDDVEADVLGSLDYGLAACLVRTGKYREGDEDRLAGTGAWLEPDLASAVDRLLTG